MCLHYSGNSLYLKIVLERSMALSTTDNYYQLLGVEEKASFEDIRQAYHDVCRRFHPDKQAAGGKLTPEQLEFWSALQTAWKCLSNEARRMIYDIRREGKALSLEDKARIQKLQRDQAARDIANMQIQYQQSLEREKQKNGIIILRALFGDLRQTSSDKDLSKENAEPTESSGDMSPNAKQAEDVSQSIEKEFGIQGPVLDVTVPLQCCVDGHRVILAAGIGKSDLPGFYNPTIYHHSSSSDVLASPSAGRSSIPCSLYVLYKFKGATHEVNVSETEALWLPLRSHAVTADKPVTGPAPPKASTTPVGSVCRAPMPAPTPMGVDSTRLKKRLDDDPVDNTTAIIIGVSAILGLAGIIGFFMFKKGQK
jgi:curved DNA-binding protein CbpA